MTPSRSCLTDFSASFLIVDELEAPLQPSRIRSVGTSTWFHDNKYNVDSEVDDNNVDHHVDDNHVDNAMMTNVDDKNLDWEALPHGGSSSVVLHILQRLGALSYMVMTMMMMLMLMMMMINIYNGEVYICLYVCM